MTNDRINEISEYLVKDTNAAKELMEMTPENAASKMIADGFEVTADELIEFGEELKKVNVNTEGELKENDLENVSGGLLASTVILGGIAIGYALGKW